MEVQLLGSLDTVYSCITNCQPFTVKSIIKKFLPELTCVCTQVMMLIEIFSKKLLLLKIAIKFIYLFMIYYTFTMVRCDTKVFVAPKFVLVIFYDCIKWVYFCLNFL